jgi:hypothetical protein
MPAPYTGQAKPGNNLALAILTTLLCCLPFGVVGIIYAAKVDSLWMAGSFAEAQKAADSAKKWSIAGIATGVAVTVLYVLFYVVILGLSAATS